MHGIVYTWKKLRNKVLYKVRRSDFFSEEIITSENKYRTIEKAFDDYCNEYHLRHMMLGPSKVQVLVC